MKHINLKILSIIFIILFFIISFSLNIEADRQPVICNPEPVVCIEELQILGEKVILKDVPEEN